jgi:dTDP-4-amino-4,6-dideoxygalactose transaminase
MGESMAVSPDPRLAIHGGTPIRTAPWAEHLTLGEEERQAVLEVMEGGRLSFFEGAHEPAAPFSFWGGPKIQELERDWCDYYGCRYAVSMNSATSGLYAAIGALGLGFGDEVIVSPYTMSASAVCALVYGAIPIFADVQLETACLDPDSIADHITPRTRAILVVHQFGTPADMDGIMALASRHGLKVIEDCAQAHGAKYKGRYVGTLGDIGVFSLNVNKTIQTGEGGVCTTNDSDLRYRLALIRNHGEAVVGDSGYENITNTVGFNYRLTELQAAIAIEQLKRLEEFNRARIEYADYLAKGLSRHPCLLPMHYCCEKCKGPCRCGPEGKSQGTVYTLTFRYLEDEVGVPREELVAALRAEGIRLGQGYVAPLYLQPVYQRKLAFKHGYPFSAPENRDSRTNYFKGACPNAERLHERELISTDVVRLPHTMADMKQIIEAVDKVMASIK